MSIPPFLDLPEGVTSTLRQTPRGPFAVLEGRPDAEPLGTAVLVPGFTGSKEDFIALLRPLMTAGYQVTAIDLSGQNETPGRPDGCYSLAGFADDVTALVETYAPTPAHLVGHSMGGLVGREAALQGLSVASLTLMCSGPGALPQEQHDRLRLFAAVLAEHGANVLWQAMQALEVEQGNRGPDDPRMAAFLAERFRRNDPRSLLAMVEFLVDLPSRNEALAALRTPTLVLTGEHDDVWYPAVQAEMAQALGVEQVVVAGGGHSPAASRPESTAAQLTQFWSRGGRR